MRRSFQEIHGSTKISSHSRTPPSDALDAEFLCYIRAGQLMKPKVISVRAGRAPYTIVCGPGIVRQAHRWVERLGPFSGCYVLSSRRVWRSVGREVSSGLRWKNTRGLIFLDDREAAKNLSAVEAACRSLVRAGADRGALLVAVGGGVVGDVAGFVAASYLRGVTLVHVPTTLVAQVDSAIGGKTGVNLREGKNLVGAFYPPRLVLADPHLLRTLPAREFRSGLAEVIKYGVIADKALFSYLESNLELLLRRAPRELSFVIGRCGRIKAGVVSKDEREAGLREILNFGHTFAHALETLTGYKKFRHGEAVAWGMVAAAMLGREAGITPLEDAARIVALVRRLGPLPRWPRVRAQSFFRAMRADKKARAGNLRFVLSPRLGRARTFDAIPLPLVERVLRQVPAELERAASRRA
ncbi:MAG TPA: 3-dehydroquinate synthase [Candidatus Acidoferrales bacterium]|nr:3-dehydroquinate synthase [Candidatus Acidoferrales bacterium]